MVKGNGEDYLIAVVDRALDVLLALGSKEGKSVRELGSELGIAKSTLYRILRTLELKDFVRQNPTTEKYSLGIRIFELGMGLKDRFEISDVAYPHMERLRDSLGETVQLAIVDKESILIVEAVDGISQLRVFSAAGRRHPITYGNFGKVFLSELPQEEVSRFVREQPLQKYGANSVTDTELFVRNLRLVKDKGVSLGIDDPIDGAYSLAVPIFNRKNEVVASISIAGPKTPDNLDRLEQIEAAAKETAFLISRELGYRGS